MSDDLFEFLATQEAELPATPATPTPKVAQRQNAPPTETVGRGPTSDDLAEFLAAQEAERPATPAAPSPPKSAAEVRAIVEKLKGQVRNARTARPL